MNDERITYAIKSLRDRLISELNGATTMSIRDYNELNRRFEAVDELAREINGKMEKQVDVPCMTWFDKRRKCREAFGKSLGGLCKVGSDEWVKDCNDCPYSNWLPSNI